MKFITQVLMPILAVIAAMLGIFHSYLGLKDKRNEEEKGRLIVSVTTSVMKNMEITTTTKCQEE